MSACRYHVRKKEVKPAMRKFTICGAQCRGNEHNTYYPYVIPVEGYIQLEFIVHADHVAGVFKGNHRSKENFLYADCILMDCDNHHSDNSADWLTPARLAELLPGVMFCIVYSKSDMKDKGENSARPRFHVYFPLLEVVRNWERISAIKEKLLSIIHEFDAKAKDAARFFYGVENPRCEIHEGAKCIDEYLSALGADVTRELNPPTKEQSRPSRKGQSARKKSPARKEQRAKTKRKPYSEKLKCESVNEFYSVARDSRRLTKLMPYRPDCMSTLKGTTSPQTLRMWRLRAIANNEYVQMNPRAYISFLVLDIDYELSGSDFWRELGLAAPYFVVFNPDNNKAHVIYALRSPVYTAEYGNAKALRYFHQIQQAYTAITKADKSYSGHLVKNPWHKKWRVIQTSANVYDLAGLVTETVRKYMLAHPATKPTRKAREEIAGLGRNCYIFEHVRIWGYRAIRKYWGGKYQEWYNAVKAECERLNAKFTPSLPACEIRSLARSISLWIWKHFSPAGFAEYQREKINYRWSKKSRKSDGIILLKAGFSVAEISEMLNVTQRTVRNWRKGQPELQPERVSKVAPWLSMGISRATWYRQQARRVIEKAQKVSETKRKIPYQNPQPSGVSPRREYISICLSQYQSINTINTMHNMRMNR